MRCGPTITALALAGWLGIVTTVNAQGKGTVVCGFCCAGRYASLRQKASESKVVLVAAFADTERGPAGESTNVLVNSVIIGTPALYANTMFRTTLYSDI